MIKSQRFDAGEIEVRINVRDGRITDIKFYGDFLSMRDVSEIEEKLKGLRYREEDIREALNNINLKEYFGGINLEELLSVIF